MLSFLKHKKDGLADGSISSSVLMRKADEDKQYESYDFDSLEVASQEFIDAVKSGDAKAVAQAFRAAFEICELEPHVENSEQESEMEEKNK